MTDRMTIFATPNTNGAWTLTDKNGAEQQEGFEYPTKAEALEAAKALWSKHIWNSKPVRNGLRIEIQNETDD